MSPVVSHAGDDVFCQMGAFLRAPIRATCRARLILMLCLYEVINFGSLYENGCEAKRTWEVADGRHACRRNAMLLRDEERVGKRKIIAGC
jgi:hypothetical protein